MSSFMTSGWRFRGWSNSREDLARALVVLGVFFTASFVLTAFLPYGTFGLAPVARLGFWCFLSWACLCFHAAVLGRVRLWAFLCLTPLTLLSWHWLLLLPESGDPWGLKMATAASFAGAAIVTAMSGVVSILTSRATLSPRTNLQ